MKPIIISSEQFTPSPWSGGETTELLLHPSSSKYSKRDFDFRLSTATVEVETSIFTPLQGVSRTLMVLDGEMTLTHEGQHTKTCGKFEIDKFNGDWKTSSVGKCTDFNLMTKGKAFGTLDGLMIKVGQTQGYQNTDEPCRLFIYVYNGQVSVTANNKPNTINKGDLLIINEFGNSQVTIHGFEESELVICKILN